MRPLGRFVRPSSLWASLFLVMAIVAVTMIVRSRGQRLLGQVTPACGNGILEAGEQCETTVRCLPPANLPANLQSMTQYMEFPCSPTCQCSTWRWFTGNGKKDTTEQCDMTALPSGCPAGKVCNDVMYNTCADAGTCGNRACEAGEQKYLQITGPDSANLSQGGSAGQEFGRSFVTIGDVDGDGIADIAVGAQGTVSPSLPSSRGEVIITLLNPDGSIKGRQRIYDGGGGIPAGTLTTLSSSVFGASVAALGDVDGDGIPDIAATDQSSLYILFLKRDGTIRTFKKLDGIYNPNDYGTSTPLLGIGDLNGDGIPDIAAGRGSNSAVPSGSVTLVTLNRDGTVKATTVFLGTLLNPTFTGSDFSNAIIGYSLADFDNLAGNGTKAMAVGARETKTVLTPGCDPTIMTGCYQPLQCFSSWMFSLRSDGSVATAKRIGAPLCKNDPDYPCLSGGRCPEYSPPIVTNVGDQDGDGVQDLAVIRGYWPLFQQNQGTIIPASLMLDIVALNRDGTPKTTISPNAFGTFPWNGEQFNHPLNCTNAGASCATFPVSAQLTMTTVGSYPDMDGDGKPELLLGDPTGTYCRSFNYAGYFSGTVWMTLSGQHCTGDCSICPAHTFGNGKAEVQEFCGEPGLPSCPAPSVCDGGTCLLAYTAVSSAGSSASSALSSVSSTQSSTSSASSANSSASSSASSTSSASSSASSTSSASSSASSTSSDSSTASEQSSTSGGTCADGTLDPGEQCEIGFACPEGQACTTSCTCVASSEGSSASSAAAQCADGNLEDGEQCEIGIPCLVGQTCNTSCQCISNTCGNGTLDTGEECDDGNKTDGDGCSATCRIEVTSCPDALICDRTEGDGGVCGNVSVQCNGDWICANTACGTQSCTGQCCQCIPHNSSSSSGTGGCACGNNYDPICAADGQTFFNMCWAQCAGAVIAHGGACDTSSAGNWEYCDGRDVCSVQKNGVFCDPISIDCPSEQQMICGGSCGNNSCNGACCRCEAVSQTSSSYATYSSSKRQSASSSAPPVLTLSPACDASTGTLFCRTIDGQRSCKRLCANFPATPSLDGFLCPPGERLQSFTCSLHENPSCAYACVQRENTR